MRKPISIKEWIDTLGKYNVGSPESLAILEESVTYGTNCFDLVFSDNPYVGLRFYYNNVDEIVIPVVIRVMIKKSDCKLDKEVLERILPSILAAEEDENVILLALNVPKYESLEELLKHMIEVAREIKNVCGLGKEAKLEGYVPTDCTQFIHIL